MRHFLVHDSRDNVGVAVVDIKSGQAISGRTLDGEKSFDLTAIQDVPLGHKIALQGFKVGDTVIKYGEDIGRITAGVQRGEHVHVHNLKTKRW